MNRSTPGFPVHHQLPGFTQTHVHRVSDAIQPSHPLSSPSPPASNPSQHQSLFQWVNSSHEVTKVLEFQLQHHSLQRNPRADLQNGLVGSPCSPRDSQESSPTPQFRGVNGCYAWGIVSQLMNSKLEEFIAIWYCYCQAVSKLTLCLREDSTPSIKHCSLSSAFFPITSRLHAASTTLRNGSGWVVMTLCCW